MNLERIAEIEAAFGEETLMAVIDFADVAELCRLARLGLRVEEAPTASGDACIVLQIVPHEWHGKRVALVVLEDSK